jgi:hypothetical protein
MPSRVAPVVGRRFDAFIAVFDPAQERGTTRCSMSFLGGSEDDRGLGIASMRIVTRTSSGKRAPAISRRKPCGPVAPALQTSFRGGSTDGFVAKIDTESKTMPL